MARHFEPHASAGGSRLNALRAAVLGANDGIVSVAALVVGVAGASDSGSVILTAGVAGLLAGALSMAAGEYVSVSTERDAERALLAKERDELANEPVAEAQELAGLYETKGLSPATAAQVAKELTAHDAFGAHAEAELRIDPGDLVNPWRAAFASAGSFTVGAMVPLAVIILAPPAARVVATFTAVFCALLVTGSLSAYAGGASKSRAALRVVVGGMLAMGITFGIGRLFGVSGI